MADMTEKRKFMRLDINVAIRWNKVAGSSQDAADSRDMTKNISAGGICFIVDEKIEPGDRISLNIELPTSKIIRAEGRVAWTKEFSIVGRENEKKYDAGIEFTDISEEDREEVKQFVFRFLNPKQGR
ncbi:MAG: PilZ domain-containing protein [Candidatus Omnitrophota bacterium]